MAFSTDFRRHIEEAARRGANPLESWDIARDLGSNTLGGADAGLVGKYFAAANISRQDEWANSNPTEYWQRQLRDAQNWFSSQMEHYSNVRADIVNKEAMQKAADLNAWRDQIVAEQRGVTAELQAAYEQQSKALQESFAQQSAQLSQAITNAESAAKLREQQRIASENLQKNTDWNTFLGGYNLSNVDNDKYAGEQSQAASYRGFLEQQLGTAGYDAGSLLSGYDPTEAINASRVVTENFDTWKNSLFNYDIASDPSKQGQALSVQSQASTQLSQYDQQIRDKLSGLGQAYQAYSSLGDITRYGGDVMSLFGFNDPTSTVSQIQGQFSQMGESYGQTAKELEMLYSGGTTPPGLYSKQMDTWQNLSSQVNPLAQGLLSTYGDARSTLTSLYGDVQAVTSGRIRSEAERQRGLLTEKSGLLSSLTGQAGQEVTRLQNLYNQTASNLRTTRIAEGQQIREQRALQDYTDRQGRLMSLAATTLQKPATRTQQVLRRTPADIQTTDPLALTRGYSSLLGG